LLLLIFKIIAGCIVSYIGYGLGRKALDTLGLEKRLTAKYWRYSIAQLGELIMLASIVTVFVLTVKFVGYLAHWLN
jgi:hypothetical protein